MTTQSYPCISWRSRPCQLGNYNVTLVLNRSQQNTLASWQMKETLSLFRFRKPILTVIKLQTRKKNEIYSHRCTEYKRTFLSLGKSVLNKQLISRGFICSSWIFKYHHKIQSKNVIRIPNSENTLYRKSYITVLCLKWQLQF